MSLKRYLSGLLLLGSAVVLSAQGAPATPSQAAATNLDKGRRAADLERLRAARAPAKAPATEVAGIPVNYDEAKVGTYVLPDALKMDDGKMVRSAKEWAKRRAEIVKLFATQQYGVAPGRPAGESFEVTDGGTPALNGKAIRKQVTIHLSNDPSWPVIHLLEYLPAKAKGPVPMFFSISFGVIQKDVDDPGIEPQKVRDPKTNELVVPPENAFSFGRIDANAFLDAGIGVATYYYAELDPDSLTGFPEGIRAKYMTPGQTGEADRAPDAWGTISAWAWGMSRVEDYFETDKGVDAKRVAIHGVSRLGKTVMWAGAHDERFAAVIASCSGEGGAALSHRNSGETIAHLMAPSRYPYQFAVNYAKYGGFPDTAPMDANMLVALIAPRPLLLQTGNTDTWSDPKGEFLAEVAAGPVYKLLGKQDLGTDVWPAAKTPIFTNGLNYYMHDGGHGMVPSDWAIYVEFLKANLHPQQ
jgi:hypothetical protein